MVLHENINEIRKSQTLNTLHQPYITLTHIEDNETRNLKSSPSFSNFLEFFYVSHNYCYMLNIQKVYIYVNLGFMLKLTSIGTKLEPGIISNDIL